MKRRDRSHDTVPFTQGRLEDDLDYSSEEDEEEEEEGEEWDEVEPGTSSQHQQQQGEGFSLQVPANIVVKTDPGERESNSLQQL